MKIKDVRIIAPKATRRDYEDWLVAFFSDGGAPTHYYDYPWNRSDRWYKISEHTSCEIPALWGSDSISVIIEEGADVMVSEECSHNNLYLYSEFLVFRKREINFIPIYSDLVIAKEFSVLVEDFRQRDERERQEHEEQRRKRDKDLQERASVMVPLFHWDD